MTGLGPSPLRLGVFAGDNPRLTGARSAPYENYFAYLAFFAVDIPNPSIHHPNTPVLHHPSPLFRLATRERIGLDKINSIDGGVPCPKR
jgi:hypothetical protein